MAERRGRPWWRVWGLPLGVGRLAVIAVVLGLLWWQAPAFYDNIDPDTQATATATTRAGILAVFAATVAALGATVALVETRRANLAADQRERYSKAIDQLGTPGDDRVDVRLGGIYSLQRIAEDSERDLPTVVEVLSAFVRGHGQGPEDDSEEALERHRPPPDVEAALRVIGRAHSTERQSHINLRGTHLERAYLKDAHLAGADLTNAKLTRAKLPSATLTKADLIDADLTRADLTEANLAKADLTRADLTGADLFDANLTRAHPYGANLTEANLAHTNLTRAILFGADLPDTNLTGAKLTDANLTGADLRGADLTRAELTRADLTRADLTGADGLTQRQLETALGDEATRLPEGLTRPGPWPSDTDDASAGTGGKPG